MGDETLIRDGDGENLSDGETRLVSRSIPDLEREKETSGGEEMGLVVVSKIFVEEGSQKRTGGVEDGLMGNQLVSIAPVCSKGQGDSGSAPALAKSSPWAKKQQDGVQAEAFIDIVNGVASMAIPDAIFDESELLWKSYVVGYFIGDAPHVGSIHATVNRIWAAPKGGTRIDVQFIEKNTVLFRIENSQMRARVIQRKYWHIADIPLVVNVWSPESALNPPDLSAMPLWVDLRGVPNNLHSHKGLRCLSKAAGKFVKLHPNTEKCVRLDVARVLVEVNLHQELVEKISFRDKDGRTCEIDVTFPWLPSHCTVCKKWGHKGQDCSSKEIKILTKETDKALSSKFAAITQDGGKAISVEGTIESLLHDLEALTPKPSSDKVVELVETDKGIDHQKEDTAQKKNFGMGDLQAIQISEPTTEAFRANVAEGWALVHGKKQGKDLVEDEELVVSPSRFRPLQDIDEEEEEDNIDEYGKETEEGEILESKEEEKKRQQTQASLRGKKLAAGSAHKPSRSKVIRTKDLLYMGKQGTSKKSSVRKI